MDAFSYLSVLFSIILGLAITQILQGYRALLLARHRVALYSPTLFWSAILLLIATQTWWASFGLVGVHAWTFLNFSCLLLQTILLYMMAGLVLPDMPADETVDLEAHYRREIKPFFLLLLAMLATSITKDLLRDGRLPGAENLAFHGLFAGVAILALSSRRHWLHVIIAPVGLVGLLAYIGLLFARL
jgi:hypothetical protein